jgi:hypothetical protein
LFVGCAEKSENHLTFIARDVVIMPLSNIHSWVPQASDDWTTLSTTAIVLSALGFLTVARWVYSFLEYVYLLLKPSKLDRYLYDSADGKPA